MDPKKEWQLQNSWFVRQTGIDVKIEKRKSSNLQIKKKVGGSAGV